MTSQTRSMTRAEAVRRRREQQKGGSTRRQTRRRGRLRAAVPPPMVARSQKLAPFLGEASRRRRRTRRRFDIALGIPGAEVHLPSLPVVRIGWRFLSGILVVLIMGLLYTLWNSPTYQVQAAEIQGIQRLTPAEVNSVLNVSGSSIFAVEPGTMLNELQEAFPELHQISIQVRFPADVVVTVEERQPVLAWQQDNLMLWVDEHGVAFPPRGEANLEVTIHAMDAPEPVLASPDGTEIFLDPALIPALIRVGESAPADTELLYDSRHGLGWLDPHGWQVFMGLDNQDMPAKLGMYQSIVQDLENRGVVPALISIEYLDAPYYRLDR